MSSPPVTTPYSPAELLDIATTAASIAQEAGQVALSYFYRGVEWEEKGHADLVSIADRNVEKIIVDRLQSAFPDHAIVGEEGSEGTGGDITGARRWYVDPIDGTKNFLQGFPTWGVSIGLADADDTLLVGVIVLPVVNEVFTATLGGGAYCNGVRLHGSSVTRIDRTAMCYGLTSQAWALFDSEEGMKAAFWDLKAQTLATRMQGASVCDFVALAKGQLDGLVAGGMQAWDVAAGLLLVREAGMTVTTVSGAPSTGPDRAIVVSAPEVHTMIRNILREHGAVPT